MAAVALASVTKLARQDILLNVAERGEQLREGLAAINAEMGLFKEIRGRGLMIGAELTAEHAGKSGDISELARKEGALVLVAGPNVMRFLPPLVITQAEMAEGLKRFKAALVKYAAGIA